MVEVYEVIQTDTYRKVSTSAGTVMLDVYPDHWVVTTITDGYQIATSRRSLDDAAAYAARFASLMFDSVIFGHMGKVGRNDPVIG